MKARTKRAHSAVFRGLRDAGYPRDIRVVCMVLDDSIEPSVLDIITVLNDRENPGLEAIEIVEAGLAFMRERGQPQNPDAA